VLQQPSRNFEPLDETSPHTPEDIAALVASHPLLTGLPGDMASLVSGCARNVAVRSGDLLLVEGEAADTLYLLRRGRVTLEAGAPGRLPVVIETLEPGAALGWSWLVPPYRWQFDARAVEPVGAIAVDAACLRAKADADPAFGYELIKRVASVMVTRLDAAQSRLLDLYGKESVAKRW
jgi:CRP-like cAMP-binding protein